MPEVTSELRVYIRHVRSCGYCATGARAWFQAKGLNWTEFLRNGISAELLRDIDDPLTNEMIERAEAEPV